MAGTLPPMMQVMRDIGGIELPESLVKLGGDTAAASAQLMSSMATALSRTAAKGPNNPK